jgi:hydrogenase maturation protease
LIPAEPSIGSSMKPKDLRSKVLLVIGVGNAWRRDDGAGLAAARALRKRRIPGVKVVESGGGIELVELFKDASSVVVVDAMSSGAKPGTLRRFNAAKRPIPTKCFRLSSHTVSLPMAVELSRALGTLPKRLVVLGIEGKDFRSGGSLSPPVERAVHKTAAVLDAFK